MSCSGELLGSWSVPCVVRWERELFSSGSWQLGWAESIHFLLVKAAETKLRRHLGKGSVLGPLYLESAMNLLPHLPRSCTHQTLRCSVAASLLSCAAMCGGWWKRVWRETGAWINPGAGDLDELGHLLPSLHTPWLAPGPSTGRAKPDVSGKLQQLVPLPGPWTASGDHGYLFLPRSAVSGCGHHWSSDMPLPGQGNLEWQTGHAKHAVEAHPPCASGLLWDGISSSFSQVLNLLQDPQVLLISLGLILKHLCHPRSPPYFFLSCCNDLWPVWNCADQPISQSEQIRVELSLPLLQGRHNQHRFLFLSCRFSWHLPPLRPLPSS